MSDGPVRPPAHVLEHEVKLSVGDDFRMPDLSLTGLPVRTSSPARTLTATYYDTDDLRLARSAVTLRRRAGGKDAGWHLKVVPDISRPQQREELQLPLGGGKDGPPAALADLVRGVVRNAPLQPIATMRTRRRALELASRDGALRVEVVDDRVEVLDGPAKGLRYRELEVEALSAEADVAAVVQVLRQTGAGPGDSRSKGARALGATAELPPIVSPPRPATPADPAELVVRNHLRRHVAVLLEQDMRARRSLPDSVHQFRVAARRLRSGLSCFGPLVDPSWASHLRSELGWVAAVLGVARDAEVLQAHLLDAVRDLSPELDRAAGLVVVQDALEARLTDGAARRREVLSAQRYLNLLDDLVAAAEVPRTTELADHPAGEVLPALVRRRFRKLAVMADRLPDELLGHDDDWHATRIAAKKARYVGEAVLPVFGEEARQFVRQMERVTELLGEHQDCAVAAQTVRDLCRRELRPAAAFTLGALYQQQRERIQRIRLQFVQEWPDIRRRRWRRWLRTKP